jgi:3-methyl-2-oxobutanoate hydroxymethyltransferase
MTSQTRDATTEAQEHSGPALESRRKITLNTLQDMKARKEPVTWLTAYDYPTALLMDRAGIEMILVGDSVGMTVLGYETTLPVTMNEMITFTAAVCRAVEFGFVIGDMPYMSYQVSPEEAVRNAGRFMAECGTDAVKLEGGARVAPVVEAITNAGIPVMAHIGLTPQSYTQLGGYKAQGRTADSGIRLIEDATVLEEAGAFAILVECVPAEVAGAITERARVPVYGLGSGDACDGQLMIVHDMLGLFERFVPKFVKRYANLSAALLDAFSAYVGEVKSGEFPKPEHFYTMVDGEAERLLDAIRSHP